MPMIRMIRFAAIAALFLTLTACGGGEKDDDPIPPGPSSLSDLSEQTFSFSNGAVFDAGLSNQEVHLAFGDLSAGEGPYTLRAGGEVAGGMATTGSCLLEVEASTFSTGEGPQAGETIHLEPCMLDEPPGQLRAENTDTGVVARSSAEASFDRYAIGNTWTYRWTSRGTDDVGGSSEITSEITLTITGRRPYRGRDAVEMSVVDTGDDFRDTYTLLINPRTGGTIALLEEGYTIDNDPEADVLPLPIEVGKTWTSTHQETRTITETGEKESSTETVRWTVTDFEAVTTPAGTFMAFQISVTRITQEGGVSDVVVYYDPVIRSLVEVHGSYTYESGTEETTTQLVSYELN